MQIPVEITYKGLGSTEALDQRIHDWVGKLERVFDRITRCEVLVETPHRHRRQGNAFHVRVRLTVPGGEIVVSHDPGPEGAHEDAYVALRDAFLAARRQLEDHVRARLRRETKTRELKQHGRVTFIDVEREWGWLEPNDGRRIYFHGHSVLGGMDELHVGDEVRFDEERGNQGPQASTVERIGANGRHGLPAQA
jgi:cold shock CspA family protein/ribosome-associated translation inhibitor RaiA